MTQKRPLSERELSLWTSLVTDKLLSPAFLPDLGGKMLSQGNVREPTEGEWLDVIRRRLEPLCLAADALLEEIAHRTVATSVVGDEMPPPRWDSFGSPPWCPYCKRENVRVLARGAAIMGCSSCLRESLERIGEEP